MNSTISIGQALKGKAADLPSFRTVLSRGGLDILVRGGSEAPLILTTPTICSRWCSDFHFRPTVVIMRDLMQVRRAF